MYSMEATYQNRNLFYKMKNNHGITQWKSSHCAQKKKYKKKLKVYPKELCLLFTVLLITEFGA